MTCNGRRKFLRTSIAAAAAVPVASALNRAGLGPIVGAQLAHADVTTALSLDHPQAKALGYQHDASKVDTAQFPKRAGAEGAKQFCGNCQLMTVGGLKADGQEGEWGKCALFPDGLVNVKGWCNSWVQKAG